MPRSARIVIPGLPHHITQRGTRRMQTFFCGEDCELYLHLLLTRAQFYGVDLLDFCLMPNHVHHIVVPESKRALSETFKQTHQIYAQTINRREGWSGHFWQERFFSDPLDPRAAVLVTRYVLMNPVRAGLAERPEDWLFSSARQRLGLPSVGPRLTAEPMVGSVGEWRELLSRDVGPESLREIRKATSRGRLFSGHGAVQR